MEGLGGFFDSSLFKPRQLPLPHCRRKVPQTQKPSNARGHSGRHTIHFAARGQSLAKERLHGNVT